MGVRRYQNPDGTLTAEGRAHYGVEARPTDSAVTKRVKNDFNTLSEADFRKKYQTTKEVYARRVRKYGDPYKNSPLAKWAKKQNKLSQAERGRRAIAAIAIGAVAAGAITGISLAVANNKINKQNAETSREIEQMISKTMQNFGDLDFKLVVEQDEIALLRGLMDDILIRDIFG